MRNKLTHTLIFALVYLVSNTSQAQATSNSGYAPVDGLKMYYKIHGRGQPLILIHGGLGSADMFSAVIPNLLKQREVITVDLQGHGRTADIDRPISYQAMADDIAGLLRYLGIAQADVMGYSMGGEVALLTTIQHPDLIRKLVVVSAAYRRDGWYPEILTGESQLNAQAAEQMKHTPFYEEYARVAPGLRIGRSSARSWAICSDRTMTGQAR